jgi:hypothetical protein
MQTETQFSVFLVNKPGVLAQVLGELAKAKVNIIAMTMADTTEHGVLRLIADDPGTARKVMKKLSIPVTEADVLAVEVPSRPGSIADICARLAADHVNIAYAYATSSGTGGKTMCIVKVADMTKAKSVLQAPPSKRRAGTLGRRPKVRP